MKEAKKVIICLTVTFLDTNMYFDEDGNVYYDDDILEIKELNKVSNMEKVWKKTPKRSKICMRKSIN